MNKKIAAYILIAVGILALLVSLGADVIGLGADPLNFGWKQILGSVVGVVVIVAGVFLFRSIKSSTSQTDVTKDEN